MEKWKWSGDQRFINDFSDGTKLSFEKDKDYGFSWPQRNYRCSFCKKEFKSAQALGGHMNVHRRDRARMRLSSPSFLDSPNPNPSFSSSSSSQAKFSPYENHSSLSCVSNPLLSASPNKELHLGPNPNENFTRDHKMSRKLQNDHFSFEKFPAHVDQCGMVCGGDRGKKNKGAMPEVARRKDGGNSKANEFVRLDLSMGFVGDAKEQDLDLELRLGYC